MPIQYNTDKESGSKRKNPPSETALVPKTLLMGQDVSPGDKVTLEVTHVFDDEVEVAYPESDKTPMDESGDELDRMARPDFGMGDAPPPEAA